MTSLNMSAALGSFAFLSGWYLVLELEFHDLINYDINIFSKRGLKTKNVIRMTFQFDRITRSMK